MTMSGEAPTIGRDFDSNSCSLGRRRRAAGGEAPLRCPWLHAGPPPHLVELHRLVAGVACQEQVVAGLDHPGEAHEQQAAG